MKRIIALCCIVLLCAGLQGCLHTGMNSAYIKTDNCLVIHPAGLVWAGHGSSLLLYNLEEDKSLRDVGKPLWVPNIQNDNNNNLNIGKQTALIPQAVSSSSNINTGTVTASSSTTPVTGSTAAATSTTAAGTTTTPKTAS